ncbi:MAG: hypothetical protein JWQ47_2509, partial [Glaciihabitans sp.]|nr:hypothetical protein [Glaciihabitans sp.]
ARAAWSAPTGSAPSPLVDDVEIHRLASSSMGALGSRQPGPMVDVEQTIKALGMFARRRDLLQRGFDDSDITAALAAHRIFRVRQGWFSVPDAPADGVEAVRVGGKLTGVAALASYGLRVPRREYIDVVVPRQACRLRSPTNRSAPLAASERARIHWTEDPYVEGQGGPWRVSLDDALVFLLKSETRDIAVACLSAVARYIRWPQSRVAGVFARAPRRVASWLPLVCALDDSHGETFVRLWLTDAGIPWESQPRFPGVGKIDGRVSPNVFVEIDGAQHDPNWTGETPSSYGPDHDRDATVVIGGGTVLRYVYRQLYSDWPRCLAAVRRAREDDLELIARREQHPSPPRSLSRKRRS